MDSPQTEVGGQVSLLLQVRRWGMVHLFTD